MEHRAPTQTHPAVPPTAAAWQQPSNPPWPAITKAHSRWSRAPLPPNGASKTWRMLARAPFLFGRLQDWGVVELMRRVAPGLPVHGSTQMSITSAEGAAWAAGLGVERVVVGRELSVKEISKVGGSAGVATRNLREHVHRSAARAARWLVTRTATRVSQGQLIG